MDKTDFAKRMKYYEGFETKRELMAGSPICARCDGINFHAFCEGLIRPYDERLSRLMIEVSAYLLDYFSADVAYTQSDEISLAWKNDDYDTEMFCGGRIQRLIHILPVDVL